MNHVYSLGGVACRDTEHGTNLFVLDGEQSEPALVLCEQRLMLLFSSVLGHLHRKRPTVSRYCSDSCAMLGAVHWTSWEHELDAHPLRCLMSESNTPTLPFTHLLIANQADVGDLARDVC